MAGSVHGVSQLATGLSLGVSESTVMTYLLVAIASKTPATVL